MVVHRDPIPAADTDGAFAPLKQTRSVACELDIRAALARDAARQMPLGDARTETLREVMILENAAEMHRHFLPRLGPPAT